MSFRDFTPRNNRQRLEFEGGHGPAPAGPPRRRKSPLRRTASGGNGGPSHPPNSSRHDIQLSRSKSDSTNQNSRRHLQSSSLANDGGPRAQSLLVQQREEEYAIRAMREREEEMRDINRKMHVVNEIYKDLGEVVDQQQEQIDRVEDEFGGAADATRRGLEQIERANRRHAKSISTDDQNLGEIPGKRKQFFIMQFLSRGANEISKMVSVCVGSGSASYVDGESWTNK